MFFGAKGVPESKYTCPVSTSMNEWLPGEHVIGRLQCEDPREDTFSCSIISDDSLH